MKNKHNASLKTLILCGALMLAGSEAYSQEQAKKAADTAYAPVAGDLHAGDILSTAEQLPEYPGGTPALIHFLSNNIIYPVSAKKAGIQGRVVARFVVDKTGAIRDIRIMRSLQDDCDREVIRVIRSMPRWKPGMQFGKPVNVYYQLPVSFMFPQK